MGKEKLHIVALSDQHGYLPDNIPACDVVCICGDIVPLAYQRSMAASVSWFVLDFIPWAQSLPCDRVIFIAGNHDFFLYHLTDVNDTYCARCSSDHVMNTLLVGPHRRQNNKIIYLMDNSYTYKGHVFYGTPWVTNLMHWAFYAPDDILEKKYNSMPQEFDVLLSHQPPIINECGLVKQPGFNYMKDFGSDVLAHAISSRNIKLALSGHVHSGEHVAKEINGTTYANVSLLDEEYHPIYDVSEFWV